MMRSFAMAGLFILMVLSPCLLALRWRPEDDRNWD
jgi:hypothetical protein